MSLKKLFVSRFSIFLTFLLFLMGASFKAGAWSIPTSPAPDFDIGTLLSNYKSGGGGSLYLSPLDNGLMGESYDIDTGAITFRHVDVSLPGNNSLPVEFARSANGQSHRQSNGVDKSALGYVWDVDIPYVITRVTTGRSGNCNAVVDASDRFSGGGGAQLDMGTKLYSPGGGERDLGSQLAQTPSGFYGSRKMATRDLWIGTCAPVKSNGVIGYKVKDPNGNTYTFDHVKKKTTRFTVDQNYPLPDYVDVDNIYMMPSEVTDVHGNWVRYSYNNHGVTQILSNDGRKITITYSGSLISRVTANGRSWDYSYTGDRLNRVDLPDGTYWTFGARVSGVDYTGMYNNGMVDNDCFQRWANIDKRELVIRHPGGTVGRFETGVIVNYVKNIPSKPYTSSVGGGGWACTVGTLSPEVFLTRGMKKKTLILPSGESNVWTYDYHEPAGAWAQYNSTWFYATTTHVDSLPDQKIRTIIDPVGNKTMSYHNADWIKEVQGYLKVGGVIKRESYASSTSPTPMRTVTFEAYADYAPIAGGASHQNSIGKAAYQFLPTIEKIQQENDVYTTEFSYNMDPSSSTFGFTSPIQTKKSSNVSTTPRVIDTVFYNDRTNWTLGLTKTVTQDGLLLVTNNYNGYAKLENQIQYGTTVGKIKYNSDGTIDEFEDAIGRITKLSNWKRGKPQTIKNAYGSIDEVTTSQAIDSNGWVTSSTDGKGKVTGYDHDVMGRLTLIDPPGNFWVDTIISYSFPSSGGAFQTITKGQSVESVTYDGMFRKVLERTQVTDTNSSSYVKTEYDALGRVSFKSQPSENSNESKGVEYTYDGLGRIYQERENVWPYAKTKHRYYSGHRHRIYDPSGAWTQTYSYGYDGPGNKDFRAIYRYANGAYQQKTYFYKNANGKLRAIKQWGEHDGFSVSKVQHLYYDAKQRLCRYYVPEQGATKYQYDNAGQMVAYAKGQANSGCGTVPNVNAKVTMTYDGLGRVKKTDFRDAATPDITKDYDLNGNVLKTFRGSGASAVNWTYSYNDLNLVTSEELDIDGRSYDSSYVYNPSGFITRRNQPNNKVVNYTVDGSGRTLSVKNGNASLASNVNYHANGDVHQMMYGNGQYFSQILNARQLPERLLSYKGSNKAIDQTLTYDARGLVTSITDGAVSGNNRTYSYDGLGYLKTASGPWGTGSYKYDSFGNLREKKLGARTVTLSYDEAKNRLKRSFDPTGSTGDRWIGYDHRGNVTSLGALAMTYDMSDQPVAISGTANGVGAANGNYWYDGNFKRVKAVVNGKTIYNVYNSAGSLIHVDAVSDAKKTDYVSGPTGILARISNGAVTYLHPNHIGSAQSGTTSSGAVAWREQYTPFGEEVRSVSANDNLAGFTGHIKDSATGLSYMKARYYDPVIGRFLSVDPMTMMHMDMNPSYFNRYAYTSNNPINLVDPTGMYGEEDRSEQTDMETYADTLEGIEPQKEHLAGGSTSRFGKSVQSSGPTNRTKMYEVRATSTGKPMAMGKVLPGVGKHIPKAGPGNAINIRVVTMSGKPDVGARQTRSDTSVDVPLTTGEPVSKFIEVPKDALTVITVKGMSAAPVHVDIYSVNHYNQEIYDAFPSN